MAESPHRLRIFLCHSSGDKQAVRDLYERLRTDGFDPWLDEENLLPGQDWHHTISEVVSAVDIVLVCLSRDSITKKGFVQKEIKYALDVADEQPENTIYLIPLKLEECDIPHRLRRWHWVNLFEATGYERLLNALRHRAESISVDLGINKFQNRESGRSETTPHSTKTLVKHSFFLRTSSKKIPIKPLIAVASLFILAAIYVYWARLEPSQSCPKSAEGETQYYEAEDAVLSGGAHEDREHLGFSGLGFVSGYGVESLPAKAIGIDGPSTTFLVDAPSDGHYQVDLCYGNGNDSPRTLTIYVNDERVKRTTLPNVAQRWNVWVTQAETLPLRAGRNAISYRKSEYSDGEVNLDFIGIGRSLQDQIIKLAHEIEAARKNPLARPQVATEPFARKIRTENGVVTECLNPPIKATLDYWPITFSAPAEDCHIYPLVDARLARDDQYYSKNKEDWERGVTAHDKDEVYVAIYVNNGAADLRGQYDPNTATAKNVVITTKTDTLAGSTHYIEVTASGDNTDTVYGRIKITTNPNERIEIVPRSGQIRNFTADRILASGFELGNNRIHIGDIKPYFQESLFIRYTIRIVV